MLGKTLHSQVFDSNDGRCREVPQCIHKGLCTFFLGQRIYICMGLVTLRVVNWVFPLLMNLVIIHLHISRGSFSIH